MKDRLIAMLSTIAGAMNSLTKAPDAVIHYDMLAGALWWSDERPASGQIGNSDCLRVVFRYRTSVIIGEPESQYLPYWLAAENEFPKWPGFAVERCRPNEGLAALYRRSEAKGLLSLDLMDINCRLEKEFQGMVPWRIIEKHADQNEPPDITVGELYELTCRCIRLAGKTAPADAWERVRHSVSESLAVALDLVTKESWLVRDLGAG
ncbi:MAG TPA: hypothetical protein VIK18_26315 [Pirellulales bacterium]